MIFVPRRCIANYYSRLEGDYAWRVNGDLAIDGHDLHLFAETEDSHVLNLYGAHSQIQGLAAVTIMLLGFVSK